MNESVPDTTGTAHTVFSFVDRKLTAKANSTQDTQAALAQLYAHIQAMPESAKKRRLVKQFNKENGQGTPRHVKNCKTKSLGDSIKKHIFQKKILGHKKCIDKIGCNITRSSSEENILSTVSCLTISIFLSNSFNVYYYYVFLTIACLFHFCLIFACIIQKLENSLLPTRMLLSKSNDEFSTENCDTTNNDLLHVKHISSSVDSFKNETLTSCKIKKKFCNQSTNSKEELNDKNMQHDAKQNLGLMEYSWSTSLQEINVMPDDNNLSDKLTRQLDEPPDVCSIQDVNYNNDNLLTDDDELVPQNSESILAFTVTPNIETSPKKTCTSSIKSSETTLNIEPRIENACNLQSPIVKNRFRNVYAVHTSTPSSLLRRSMVTNDYILTPITNNDKSMSPITQSATKMTKAMQVSKYLKNDILIYIYY